MTFNMVTNSPKTDLADLFLDAVQNLSPNITLGMGVKDADKTFQNILENSYNQVDKAAQEAARQVGGLIPEQVICSNGTTASTPPPEPIRLGTSQNKPRCTPWEEMQRQLESLNLPDDSTTLPQESLDDLKKVLQGSGFDDDQIDAIFKKLSEGELTVGRIISTVNSFQPSQKKSKLTISEDTIPMLGQFLEELGLNASQVQSILDELKPGDSFSASKLQDLLKKHSDINLKRNFIENVDLENFKEMLSSMGVGDKDLERLVNTLTATKGKMSLEGLMGFLRSVDRPEVLTDDQMENIQAVMKDLKLSAALKKQPVFNRILSLLQAMGDKEIDQKFMNASPAVQALRGGVTTANNVTEGMGAFGQGNDSGAGQNSAGNDGQYGLTGSETRMINNMSATKSAGTFQSRLAQSVALQVAEKMIFQARNNQNRLQLQLEPRDMGRLNINMVVRQNHVTASIVAENPMAKEALEQQISQLRDSLAEQGLTLERFDVSLNNGNRDTWSNQSEARANRSQNRGQVSRAGENDEIDLSSTPTTAARGLVDRVI